MGIFRKIGPKCHKDSPWKKYCSKKLVSKEIFISTGFKRKNLLENSQTFGCRKSYQSCKKTLGMNLQYFMYLYSEIILDYLELAKRRASPGYARDRGFGSSGFLSSLLKLFLRNSFCLDFTDGLVNS